MMLLKVNNGYGDKIRNNSIHNRKWLNENRIYTNLITSRYI